MREIGSPTSGVQHIDILLPEHDPGREVLHLSICAETGDFVEIAREKNYLTDNSFMCWHDVTGACGGRFCFSVAFLIISAQKICNSIFFAIFLLFCLSFSLLYLLLNKTQLP